MKHKPNFQAWARDEMRMTRREIISKWIQDFSKFHRSAGLESVKKFVRSYEIRHYGFELKAYFYFRYQKGL